MTTTDHSAVAVTLPRADEWTTANQRLLVAEFERLLSRLQPDGDARAAGERVHEARAGMPSLAAIDVLVDAFGLSAFERDLLLLCAGVEMDARVAARCSAASDGRDGPTFALALAVFEDAHWSALSPNGPLRRWRLVEMNGGGTAGLVQSRLRIDERILHYIAGVNALDSRLRSLVKPVEHPPAMAASQRHACHVIRERLADARVAAAPVVQLVGDDSSGQSDVAAAVCLATGCALYSLRVEDVPAGHEDIDAFATLWAREVALLGAALLLRCGDASLPPPARTLVEAVPGLVFVSTLQAHIFDRVAWRIAVDKPSPAEQKDLWSDALGETPAAFEPSLAGVAGQFRLSARTIAVEGRALRSTVAKSADADRELWAACRAIGRTRLDDLAQRLDVAAGWDDLVLPQAQRAILGQIAAHVRHRLLVHDAWGFADRGTRGLGISALFAGDSGTGKTLAAEVLGHELQLDLYRIDLSSVVSKYIGETEKNLRRVFDAAEESGAILLFDEADALFGKRSEVKDSHDRYANIEVSYLLQRMEAYRGLAILTSNLKGSIDQAFQRRIRFIVQFPFPDAAQREAIWRTVFPSRTPLSSLNYARLAQLNMAGGSIRNIAVNAAFAAADAGTAVTMTHLLTAAHQEAVKRERPLSDAETRGWL